MMPLWRHFQMVQIPPILFLCSDKNSAMFRHCIRCPQQYLLYSTYPIFQIFEQYLLSPLLLLCLFPICTNIVCPTFFQEEHCALIAIIYSSGTRLSREVFFLPFHQTNLQNCLYTGYLEREYLLNFYYYKLCNFLFQTSYLNILLIPSNARIDFGNFFFNSSFLTKRLPPSMLPTILWNILEFPSS